MTEAYGIGASSKLAVKKGTVWGTAVQCGALDGVPFESESLTPDITLLEDEQLNGSIQQLHGDAGDKLFSGDAVTHLKYQGLEHLIAYCMGTAGLPTQQSTTLAYKHELKISTDNIGYFLTFVFEKIVKLWEFDSVKVGGFTISHTRNEKAKLTLNLIPKDLSFASAINTAGTFASVTFPTERDFLKFSQLSVLINTQEGAELAAAHKVYLTGYDITFSRGYETDDVTTQFGDSIDEPVGDGFVKVSGSLTFSKYQTLNEPLMAAQLSKANMKMRIGYKGTTEIATGYYHEFNLWLPDLQFTEGGAPIGGPGRIGLTMGFNGWKVPSIPSGFPTGFTDALSIEIQNLNNADPLA